MNTAELIVKALDCAADRTCPAWADPEVARAASAIRERYRAYKAQGDFESASLRARVEVVAAILAQAAPGPRPGSQ